MIETDTYPPLVRTKMLRPTLYLPVARRMSAPHPHPRSRWSMPGFIMQRSLQILSSFLSWAWEG